jgi:predicted ArsR family transcriptional regulator
MHFYRIIYIFNHNNIIIIKNDNIIRNKNNKVVAMNAKAKLLLHPVRMRIVQTLVGDRKLTVQEMGQRLPDVPQATLYRHLNQLVQGNIIKVVSQNQVRGTIERVYGLAQGGSSLSAEEFQKSTKEEQMEVFMQFISMVINGFGSYLEQDHIDLVKDGVTFRQADFYLSDEEFAEFIQSLGDVYRKAMQYEPAEGRRKRTISTIIVPEAKKGESNR